MKTILKSIFYNTVVPLWHLLLVSKIRKEKKIRITFIVIKISLWKYQALYDILSKDNRFELSIVLSPSTKYSRESQLEDLKNMRRYFDQLGISYVDWNLENNHDPVDIKTIINPHILFYPQPYDAFLTPKHRYTLFWKSLICYYPYAFWMIAENWGYNLRFHNIAWKLYYGTTYNLEDAKKISLNHGRNVKVVGYPDSDILQKPPKFDPWKCNNKRVKRIIWAPHFTIKSAIKGVPPRSNFLWMADFMLDIAQRYSDKIFIAFKPHPRLQTELYKHPEWGKSKTDMYFKKWSLISNGQLETESYFDLFKCSDAMIHDCGSFSADYLYLNKPVMFVSQNIEYLKSTVNDLGKFIYACHYIGKNNDDIISFVDKIVVNGNDSLKPTRETFIKNYLITNENVSVAQKTYDDIICSLRLK